jgi:hypothetical protein
VKLKALWVILFGNLVGLCLHANENLNQLQETYNLVREARREMKRQETQEQAAPPEDLVVCIQCPQINGLVGEINRAMGHMVENGQIELSERGALEEIEKLEALYYIVENDLEVRQMVGDDSIQEPCSFYQLDIYLQNINSEPLRPSELTEVFSFTIPLHQIRSLHYRRRDEKGRYYFYRAAPPDQDKIIKVHLPRDGLPTVTYYQMGTMPSPQESDYMRQRLRQQLDRDLEASLALEENAQSREVEQIYGMEYWGNLGQYESENSRWTYGVAVAQKDNLPRRILLLQGEDETQLVGTMRMRTEVEISDRDQEVQVAFRDEHHEYLRLKAEADGDYRAAVPFAFSLEEYSLGANGELAQTESGQEANLSFFSDGARLINVRARNNNDGTQSLNVGNSFDDVFLRGTLSVEYERKNNPVGDSEAMWFRYVQRF